MLSDSVMICQWDKLFTQLMRSRMTICSGVSNGSVALATIRAFPASPRSMFVWCSSPKARRTRSAHSFANSADRFANNFASDSMNDAMNITERAGLCDKGLDQGTRRHIDSRGRHPEAGFAQSLCRRIGVFLAQIGKQNVLACADPPRNSLTDRSGADNYDNLCHDVSFWFVKVMFNCR